MPFPGYHDTTAQNVSDDNIAYAGLSSKLWRDVDPNLIQANPGYGYFHMERFDSWVDLTTETSNEKATMNYLTGGQAVRPQANYAGAIGPTLAIDSEGTDNQGIESLQFLGQTVQPTAGWDILFETRVAIEDVANAPSLFMGLAAIDAALLEDSSGQQVSADDYIAFQNDEALTCFFGVEDGTESKTALLVHTFVDMITAADGKDWVKLGFRYKGTGTGGEYYVNGVKGTQSITWTAGPGSDTALTLVPSFAILATGAADAILRCHWYAVAQVPSEV